MAIWREIDQRWIEIMLLMPAAILDGTIVAGMVVLLSYRPPCCALAHDKRATIRRILRTSRATTAK
jgi:hypothetical protein